jgi:hypothetical protein
MNTPSHAIVNLAVFSQFSQPQGNLAIAVGAILPDLPIFWFYLWAKFIQKLPERQIWSESYWQPGLQNWVALFHSIPVAIFAAILADYCGWETGKFIFMSMVIHSLGDLPVHHDDAHRHFFPISDYRLISPISYWDPQHYGRIVAGVEVVAVWVGTAVSFPGVASSLGKGLMVTIAGLSAIAYFYIYARPLVQNYQRD